MLAGVGRVFFIFCCEASLVAQTKPLPPRIMLWSWQASDDFRFLKASDIGVAYLALSIQLNGRDDPIPGPRLNPVRIGPDTFQTVEVRIDFDSYGTRRPAFSERQRRLTVQMIGEIAELSHAQSLQIDFDAPASAYPFYRSLLMDVRERLGPKVFLSMTALVSWCETGRSWMSGLPVDEIVPMAFYMGQATPAITSQLAGGGQFGLPECRNSIGTDLEDPRGVRPHKTQRAYFFNSFRAWSPELVRAAMERIDP
jgi:hypothetical protein